MSGSASDDVQNPYESQYTDDASSNDQPTFHEVHSFELISVKLRPDINYRYIPKGDGSERHSAVLWKRL